jgi:hypothetical protein
MRRPRIGEGEGIAGETYCTIGDGGPSWSNFCGSPCDTGRVDAKEVELRDARAPLLERLLHIHRAITSATTTTTPPTTPPTIGPRGTDDFDFELGAVGLGPSTPVLPPSV